MNFITDDVRRLFIRFLIPAVSSSVAVAVYSLVDTIVIGQGVGAEGTAACAIVLPIFSIANFIALLCGIGGSVLRSYERGRNNERQGDMYFSSSVFLVAIITSVAWLLGNITQNSFYRLCGADAALLPYAADYGFWIFLCLPSFVITAFLGAFVRADGSPRFVLFSTLAGGVINMIGDWVLVFPLNMGMSGACWVLWYRQFC